MEEFGAAELGDRRRVARLVRMASALLAHTAGTITQAFGTPRERRGAFDFLASVAVTVLALTQAIWTACARRCADFEWVYVPIDGSSLALRDPFSTRGTGAVGTLTAGGRGLQVMTAIAVSPGGVGLGLCGQHFWRRALTRIKDTRARRKFAQKESRFWVDVANQVLAAFSTAKVRCVPWFQLDRGGDIGDVLLYAVDHDWRITVRASYNRRLCHGGSVPYLWPTVLKQPVLGRYALAVPEGTRRRARTATMSVRACTVTLRLKDQWTKKVRVVTVGAVLTREVHTTPHGETPLEWMLLTTAPRATFADARRVIEGYSQRWKVELFQNLWKSGRGEVEATRLHEGDRIQKWATILGSVAMRTLQLTYQARETPEAPADEMLSRDEIDAAILLREPKGYTVGDVPPLGLAVRWIAEIGGFMNHGKDAPPGKLVVGRGLDRIAGAVTVLEAQRRLKSKPKVKR